MKSFLINHQTQFSIAVLLLGAIWIGITAIYFDISTNGYIPAPKEHFLAPEFNLETTAGENMILSELRGRVVLINFWTSWCPPCKAEMPAMQRVYQNYKKQGFEILAINATTQDSRDNAAEFSASFGLTFPILLDLDGSVIEQYQVRSFPTSFFVDNNGIVREVVVGGPMSEALLETRTQRYIEGQ